MTACYSLRGKSKMNNNGIFITATGTDIGKTLITAGIIKFLRENNIDAIPMKPIQSGAKVERNGLVATDLELCLNYSNIKPTQDEIKLMSPFKFQAECSPHLASKMSNCKISIPHIIDCYRKLSKNHSAIMVEGAGGIMVPLACDSEITILNLIKKMKLPVILVASTALGTINHTLLSIDCLKQNKIELAGIIFNSPNNSSDDSKFINTDNPKTISRLREINILGNIPHLQHPNLINKEDWSVFLRNSTSLQKYLLSRKY